MSGFTRAATLSLLLTSTVFVAPAFATFATDAGGTVAVFCAPSAPQAECGGGFWQRSVDNIGLRGSSYSDSLDIRYSGPDGSGFLVPGFYDSSIASAVARQGLLRAAAFTSAVAPLGAAAAQNTGAARASFQDMLTVTGTADVLRTIDLHFSLSGGVGGSPIPILPNGIFARRGDDATATLDVTLVARRGTSTLFPTALTPTRDQLSRSLNGANDPRSVLDFRFEVSAGNEIDINAILSVFAQSNGYADFGHTVLLDSITVPADIGLFAESGELFRDGGRYLYTAVAAENPPPPPPPPPIENQVPAPASLALLIGALAGLRLRRR